jgi:hypothetical protein
MDYTAQAAQQGTGFVQSLGSGVWWTVFLAVALFFLVYTIILFYHWFRFSMRKDMAVMATILYLAVGLILLFAMLSAVVSLSVA